jgi:hypothetical protein
MNNYYRPWTGEEIEKLKECSEKKQSIETICTELKRSKLSVSNQLKKVSVPSFQNTSTVLPEPNPDPIKASSAKIRRTDIEKAAINFLDMTQKDKDYSNVWASILDFQGALEEKSIEQREVKIKINTNQWIGIAMVGDLHIGNMATDYKTMLYHRDLIAKTKNLYVALNGDYCDNFIPTSHAAGMFEALFPPAVQKSLAKNYIEIIKDKVLAIVSGCHEAFGQKAADFDLTEYLAKHGEAAYLGNGGTIYLSLGKVTYKIMMRHKYRYNNQDNPTATVKKMFEKCGGFDVGVVSHNHIAALEETVKEGMDGYCKRLFIRAGTYKTHDRYGRQLGFSEGDTSVPIVLMNPHAKDIRGFQQIEEGIEYLAYLNKNNGKKRG